MAAQLSVATTPTVTTVATTPTVTTVDDEPVEQPRQNNFFKKIKSKSFIF
jgi:hypothetical protein